MHSLTFTHKNIWLNEKSADCCWRRKWLLMDANKIRNNQRIVTQDSGITRSLLLLYSPLYHSSFIIREGENTCNHAPLKHPLADAFEWGNDVVWWSPLTYWDVLTYFLRVLSVEFPSNEQYSYLNPFVTFLVSDILYKNVLGKLSYPNRPFYTQGWESKCCIKSRFTTLIVLTHFWQYSRH